MPPRLPVHRGLRAGLLHLLPTGQRVGYTITDRQPDAPFTLLILNELLFDRVPRPQVFEDNLWAAADRLRAKSNLKASEYAAPLLGLFFLRYATNRFEKLRAEAEAQNAAKQTGRNVEEPTQSYVRVIGFVVPEAAHYDRTLLQLSGTDNAQERVIAAMVAFEQANPDAGIRLPQADYRKIPDDVLRDILAKIAELRVSEGDVFGRIYEYFLGKFALSEGQKGGEFYTPRAITAFMRSGRNVGSPP